MNFNANSWITIFKLYLYHKFILILLRHFISDAKDSAQLTMCYCFSVHLSLFFNETINSNQFTKMNAKSVKEIWLLIENPN